MLSSDRRHFLCLMAALPLGSCGFTPAYGPGGPAGGMLNKVGIDDPTDKNAFDFVGRMQELLGRTKSPVWQLSYQIATYSVGLGITSSSTITRYNLTGTINYTLRDIGSGAVVTSGSVKNFTSYSASSTVVSTVASERDAYTRLMRVLADQVVNEMTATSATWVKP